MLPPECGAATGGITGRLASPAMSVMKRRLALVASQHQGAVFNTPAPNTTAPSVICCLENNSMYSRLKIHRHGRGLTHQGDGDAAIGRDEGVIRKQRLGVGPAGDHEETRRRYAFF